ncbi:MAG: hypothetical protein PHY93_11055 [Bacteriovorax sp.]|nr:hypothetical protein [Bacteriovorax sp.]
MKLSLIFSVLIYSQLSFSAEADNFTARSLNLIDVSGQVNTEANNFLKTAVEKVNQEGNCDQSANSEAALYMELRKYFSNHSKGELVKNILYTETISKNSLPLKESIYKEWSPMNGYLLGRKKAAASPLALSPLIQIGDQIIGVDKLEHMFGMGFNYFTQYYSNQKSIQKILKGGILKEKTFLGGNILATGVFSYADLSANFNGMRFWNHVLLKHDDILGSENNLGPYVSCVDAKWKVEEKNPIDFKNYIDSSMDESINCSKFASKSGEKKFKTAIKNLGLSCPVDPARLRELQNKYGPSNIQHFIINDEGTGTVSYFNEF